MVQDTCDLVTIIRFSHHNHHLPLLVQCPLVVVDALELAPRKANTPNKQGMTQVLGWFQSMIPSGSDKIPNYCALVHPVLQLTRQLVIDLTRVSRFRSSVTSMKVKLWVSRVSWRLMGIVPANIGYTNFVSFSTNQQYFMP